MKKLFIIILILSAYMAKSQTQLFDISSYNGFDYVPGAHYKDLEGVLNAYEGNYELNSSTHYFKIILQKKFSNVNNLYSEDLIIGEYQYKLNGVEKLNTLENLNLVSPNKRNHSIDGNTVVEGNLVGCLDCNAGEKVLWTTITDDSTHNVGDLLIRKVFVDGVEAIKVYLSWRVGDMGSFTTESSPLPKIANGTYVLTKL